MTHATKLKDAMTEYPTISSVRTTVSEASELMKKLGIRHLPVVDEGVVVGVISDRDLRQAEMLSDAMTLFVTDVMSAKPYCAKVGTPLAEVAREMADRKVGSVVVINERAQPVGIFTTTDGMRLLSELLASADRPDLALVPIDILVARRQMGRA
jgi:acetoin utilization protein AcuB